MLHKTALLFLANMSIKADATIRESILSRIVDVFISVFTVEIIFYV